jgi:HlyD family secretion protein
VGDRVELLDGIGADAVVIATGAGFLNEGDLVKVAPAPAPAATAATAPPALAPAAPAAKP